MDNRDLYYNQLSRRYGDGTQTHYNTPQAPRMTEHKMHLLSKGLPLVLLSGTIKVTDRGDLVFENAEGELSQLVNTPDELLIRKFKGDWGAGLLD
jgi:hypothetical protein